MFLSNYFVFPFETGVDIDALVRSSEPYEISQDFPCHMLSLSCRDLKHLMKLRYLGVQGGPLPCINGVTTPISRVITQLPIYKAIYRSYNPSYNW